MPILLRIYFESQKKCVLAYRELSIKSEEVNLSFYCLKWCFCFPLTSPTLFLLYYLDEPVDLDSCYILHVFCDCSLFE